MKKNYTPDFKTKVVMELLKEELTIGQLSSKHEVHRSQLNQWKKTVQEGIPELLSDGRKRDKRVQEYEEKARDLYAQIGELTAKLNWLKKNLVSTFSREERLNMLEESEEMSKASQCELLSLNRSSLFYRSRAVSTKKLGILNAIDEIFTEDPTYGARRIEKAWCNHHNRSF